MNFPSAIVTISEVSKTHCNYVCIFYDLDITQLKVVKVRGHGANTKFIRSFMADVH